MKRILAGLLAMLVAVGLGLSAARPALANGQSANGCNDVGTTNIRVCLYNSTNFSKATGFWQRDFATVNQGCVVLSNHAWHIGGPVNDASSSVIITAGTVPANTRFRVRFYDWVNCSSANGYFDLTVSGSGGYNVDGDLYPNNWNNRIGSVQIFLQAI